MKFITKSNRIFKCVWNKILKMVLIQVIILSWDHNSMFIRNVVWLMIVNQPFMKWLFSPSPFVSCSLERFCMALSSLTFVSSVAHSFVVKQTVCVIWIFLSYIEHILHLPSKLQTNILFRNLLIANFVAIL